MSLFRAKRFAMCQEPNHYPRRANPQYLALPSTTCANTTNPQATPPPLVNWKGWSTVVATLRATKLPAKAATLPGEMSHKIA